MFHDLLPLPLFLGKWVWKNTEVVNFGLFVSWLACVVITYKVKQAAGGRFRRQVLRYLYSLNFFLFFNMLTFHPFYNSFWNMAAGLPGMISLILLARYMVLEFGIGGQRYESTQYQPVQHHHKSEDTFDGEEPAPDAEGHLHRREDVTG